MNEFSRHACQKRHSLRKETLLAMIEPLSQTHEFFLGIPEIDWEILSFNPVNREVCVEIKQLGQTKTMSVTLPPIL